MQQNLIELRPQGVNTINPFNSLVRESDLLRTRQEFISGLPKANPRGQLVLSAVVLNTATIQDDQFEPEEYQYEIDGEVVGLDDDIHGDGGEATQMLDEVEEGDDEADDVVEEDGVDEEEDDDEV